MAKDMTFLKRKNVDYGITIALILGLSMLRILLGIHTNFTHEDYKQIYLMGLENALYDQWSYWGPDIVWSKTRLAGAMQGLIVGIPIQLFKNAYAPIIWSNIISITGLLSLAFYMHKRLPSISKNFLIAMVLLIPFTTQHGVVLLNTAHIIFSSALFFISVFELFLFREQLLFKKPPIYFAMIGFALLFTFQLHLAWVCMLPFIIVLSFLEFRNKTFRMPNVWMFLLGALIGGLTLIPTIIKYPSLIFMDTESTLHVSSHKLTQLFDIIVRYFNFATFDFGLTFAQFKLTTDESKFHMIAMNVFKYFGALQLLGIWTGLIALRKDVRVQRALLLFSLTVVMIFVLNFLSDKHLSSRSYIFLFPIPLLLSFFAYQWLFKFRAIKTIAYAAVILPLLGFSLTIQANYQGPYSVYHWKDKIDSAIEKKDPRIFCGRRFSKVSNWD